MGDYNTEHTAVKDLRVVLPATVRFDANGGSGTMDDVTVAMGDDYTLPANGFTAPDGKVFDKWRIGDTTYEPGATVTVNGDVTVTALWVDAPVTYTVTFRDNDGATVLSGPRAYPKDTPAANVTVPAVPNKTEGGYQYKFKEWDHPIAAVTADATYTATYTKGYTVTLTPGAGSGTDVTVQPIWEDDNTRTRFPPSPAASPRRPARSSTSGRLGARSTIRAIRSP